MKSYSYDALQRLKLGGTAAAPERYSYDPEGNRTSSHLSTTYVTDAANRLLEDDTFRYAYDANGNLSTKTEKANGAATTYRYDAQDQLVGVDLPNGTLARYRFDALGRRIEKLVGATATRYVYDGSDILLEYDGGNSFLARYAQGDHVDQPLAFERGGSQYFYHVNHQGSIRQVTDAAGAKVDEYDYDAYGKATTQFASVPQPFGFTARELDAENGLMHFRARAYTPRTGRFMQEDPLWLKAGDFNYYRYVSNRPIAFTDPLGREAEVYGAIAAQASATGLKSAGIAVGIRCVLNTVTSALANANAGRTNTSSAEEALAQCYEESGLPKVPGPNDVAETPLPFADGQFPLVNIKGYGGPFTIFFDVRDWTKYTITLGPPEWKKYFEGNDNAR